jgi:thiosulfate/3-mercaptopyruvate sulfurtransferase
MTSSRNLKTWLRTEGFGEGFGADLNVTLANATTPLMRAALKGELEIAKQILATGGKIAARNADGNNALWLACVEGHLALLELLIKAGIDIDNRNDNGATALMYAASSGRTEVVALLLARGADIHAGTLDGFSALDMAANIDCLNLLRAAHKKSPTRVRAGRA